MQWLNLCEHTEEERRYTLKVISTLIREGKNGMVFWRCSQHKSGCTARATSEGTSVVVQQQHSHPASQETLAVEKAVSNMRKRAREDPTSVPRIYDQAMQVNSI